jgi:hypothetical protein
MTRLEDRLLGRLVRRRLRRVAAQREGADGSEPSSWNPDICAAQERLIRTYAAGRSFADIACMWQVDGACAFLAEQAGATRVTAMDKWPRTDRYLDYERRAGSPVAFVEGDIHDSTVIERIGEHDVVWCSGLLYHVPHPVMTMGMLVQLTGRHLIVGTKSVPQIPGLPGIATYYPGLPDADRRSYAVVAGDGVAVPYDPQRFYANWYWGLSPEALLAIARSLAPFRLVERVDLPFRRRHDDVYLVLEKQPPR